MSMNTNSDASSFFSQFSGGGGGAPSFAFQKIGDTVKGRVVSCKMMDQTYFGTSDKIPDGKGGYKKQLQVVLDTNLRNWEGLKKTPTDQDGVPQPASEDTGARAIYVKGWMIGPVSDAISKATGGERNFPVAGDILAVQFSEETPTNKGNPLKKFAANAKAAPEGFGDFAEAQEEKTAAATAPAGPSLDLEDEDDGVTPPF